MYWSAIAHLWLLGLRSSSGSTVAARNIARFASRSCTSVFLLLTGCSFRGTRVSIKSDSSAKGVEAANETAQNSNVVGLSTLLFHRGAVVGRLVSTLVPSTSGDCERERGMCSDWHVA